MGKCMQETFANRIVKFSISPHTEINTVREDLQCHGVNSSFIQRVSRTHVAFIPVIHKSYEYSASSDGNGKLTLKSL